MKRRRTSSRLARHQGKKMARQSVVTIVLSIAGLLIFLFVIAPQLVQLFFRFFGGGELSLEGEDIVPPQIPIINPLPEATTEPLITLEGFGEAESEVVIVLNGDEVGRTEINQQGDFSYSLGLDEGDNEIVIYGVDEADNESNTKQLKVILDTEAPSLSFEDLDNGKEVVGKGSQSFVIRGETEPASDLTLNEKNVYVKLDGTFSATYYLQEGENTLKFVVVDQAGNTIEREVKINFKL